MKFSKDGWAKWGLCLAVLLAWNAAAWSQDAPPPAEEASGQPVKVSGMVDSVYGPLVDARVRVAGREAMVLTGPDGGYHLDSTAPPQGPVVVTAGKEGWFNNGAWLGWGGSVPRIRLNPVYLMDQQDYRFYPPTTCFQCHGNLTRVWSQSKMAHATSNPKLWDAYFGTNAKGGRDDYFAYRRDFPDSQGDCAQCHAPSAAANPVRSLNLMDIMDSPLTEWDGISCDYCHKVRDVVPDSNRPSRAKAVQERQYPAQGRSILVFGPYDDVVTPPMAASYGPIFEKGDFCASCHGHFRRLPQSWDHGKVYSEAEWRGFGLEGDRDLPIQTTYREWRQWQESLAPGDPNKGKRCQNCHMSWQKRMLPYTNYVVDGMARHMFGGTYRSPRNIHPHHFEGGTQTQLQNALAMELEGSITGDKLTVKVHVSNTNGGHWVPTGETMRNVLLLVQAKSLSGKPLELVQGPRLPEWAGKGDPAQGDYAGMPGVAFARVLADAAGNLNVPFWRATRVAVDTRVRPKSTVTHQFVYRLTDPNDEPAAEAKLIYRPVVRPLTKAKGWQVPDTEIAAKAW